MQARVARRVPRIVTVSESSRRDIAGQLGVALGRIAVVPVGVDDSVFRPHAGRRPGAGPDHDHGERGRADEGAHPAPGGTREGAHRAPRCPSRGHRPPEGRQRDPGRAGPFRAERRRPLRLRGERPGDRRSLRGGRARGRAIALRGFLAAGGRGDGLRGPAHRHDRRGAARGRRDRRRHRTARRAGRSRRPRPGHHYALSATSELRRRLGAAGRKRDTPSASPGRSLLETRPSSTASCWPSVAPHAAPC